MNKKTIQDIENRYYFEPIKKRLEKKIKEVGNINPLNYLTEIMQNSTQDVEKIIQKRISDGIISIEF